MALGMSALYCTHIAANGRSSAERKEEVGEPREHFKDSRHRGQTQVQTQDVFFDGVVEVPISITPVLPAGIAVASCNFGLAEDGLRFPAPRHTRHLH
jgi:hypothetical protein